MIKSSCAVALAARLHARNGSPRGDAEAVERLRAAAVALGQKAPEILAGPSDTTRDAVLVLPLASPEAILGAILTIADKMRPGKTTFAASVWPSTGPLRVHRTRRWRPRSWRRTARPRRRP
jgi:hypothetical protein